MVGAKRWGETLTAKEGNALAKWLVNLIQQVAERRKGTLL